MTDHDLDGLSLWGIAAALVRGRWYILLFTVLGGAVAAALVYDRPLLYPASVAFVTQGGDGGGAGLQDIAGRIGLSLPAGDQSRSPDFYLALLDSRSLLTPVTEEELTVREEGRATVPFRELYEIEGDSPEERTEEAVDALRELISTSIDRNTGIVGVSVTTRWPSVSMALAERLLEELNSFNQRLRRTRAGAERQFIEERLELAAADLRRAEDAVTEFLRSNREFRGSPDLSYRYERLQREVALRQQVYTSLALSYEEARIKEVRDIPAITIIETPVLPTEPASRGRVKAVVLGLLTGAFLACVLAILLWIRARGAGVPHRGAADFRAEVAAARTQLRRWFGRSGS